MFRRRWSRSPRRESIPPILLGYAGLAGFLALEATARRPGEASRLDETRTDEGTTQRIVRAYAIGAVAPAAGIVAGPRLPRTVAWLGLGVQAAGLVLRAWSMRVLGEAYTRTLRTGETRGVVASGPYAHVRHPGYLGSILIWIGFGLTSRNPAVVAIVGGVIGDAYARRIASEERLLRRGLAGYDAYTARTSRLVPHLW